jgi:hypothetical protein
VIFYFSKKPAKINKLEKSKAEKAGVFGTCAHKM